VKNTGHDLLIVLVLENPNKIEDEDENEKERKRAIFHTGSLRRFNAGLQERDGSGVNAAGSRTGFSRLTF
jgi:hypothetical protein